jgi:hypothetical protein
LTKVEIYNDGVCVFVNNTIIPSRSFVRFIQVAIFACVLGILALNVSQTNSMLYQVSLILIVFPIVVIVPMLRTILWSLYGKESLVISTKSTVQNISFGVFSPNPSKYNYDHRVTFAFELLRTVNGVEEGFLHVNYYDADNQPIHLFQTRCYLSVEDAKRILLEVDRIFLNERLVPPDFSAN